MGQPVPIRFNVVKGQRRLEIPQVDWRVREAMKTLHFARWDKPRRQHVTPATPACVEAVVNALVRQGLVPALHEPASELLQVAREIPARLATLRDPDSLLEPLPFRAHGPEPWRHQLAAYHAAMACPGCLLYLGMGAGKTRVTLDIIRGRKAKRVLVVAPKSVVRTWGREAWKWAPGLEVLELDRRSVKKRTEIAEARFEQSPDEPLIVAINYESVWREPFASWALQAGFDLVVADEVQRIKAPGSKASGFFQKLGTRVPYRLGLTGTPTPHSPLDAYGIFRFLDPGIFGTSYTAFRHRYAEMGGFEDREVVAWRNRKEMSAKFYSITLKVDRDVLELPEAHHITREIEMPAAGRRIYSEMAKEFVADINSGVIATAANALSRLMKLQQIAQGHIRQDDETHQVHTGKRDALVEVLGELPPAEPVVVFARFRADLDLIHEAAKKLGRASLELSGRTNDLEAWQGAEAPILATQIQAGGVGVDLTRAAICIYFSQTHSLGDYDQSLARVHRPGQDRSVTYVHLVVRGTVEERIYAALENKRDVIEEILGSPRETLLEAA